MKILHITNHLNMGGVSRYLLDISKGLSREGVECVIASSGGELESYLQGEHIPCIRLPLKTKFEFHPKLFVAIFKAAAYVKKENVDVIHCHTRVAQVVGAVVSKVTGVPYVSTCHGHFNASRASRRIFPCWGKKVIAVSDAVKSHLIDEFRLPETAVTVIYTGLRRDAYEHELSDEDRKELQRKIGVPEYARLIGSIGRLSPVKGYTFLIHALEELKERFPALYLVLIGDGPQEKFLKELAADLGLAKRVVFVRSDFNARRYLPLFDVYCSPSLQEGLGLSLLEAMASKRPCVATAVGGIKDIIRDGENGLLVESCNAHNLAVAIRAVVTDGSFASKLGEAAFLTIEKRFNLDDTIRSMLHFYKEVINGENNK